MCLNEEKGEKEKNLATTGTFSSVRNFGALHKKILTPIRRKGREGEGIAGTRCTNNFMNSLGYARGTADSIQQSEKGEWMQASISQSSHSASCGRLPKEVRSFDADLHIVFMDIGILSCKQNIFTLKATQLYNEWLLSCFLP